MTSGDYPVNFSRRELLRSITARRYGIDNVPDSETTERNLLRLAWSLQAIRNEILFHTDVERSISVSSGYRCKELNSIVTGNVHSRSRHMYGIAADITVQGWSSYRTAIFIRDNMPDFKFHKAINEYGEWLHISLPHEDESSIRRFLTADSNLGAIRWRRGLFDV